MGGKLKIKDPRSRKQWCDIEPLNLGIVAQYVRQLDINKRGFVWRNNNIINLSESRSLIKIKTRHIQKRGDIITGKPDAINRMDMKEIKVSKV